MKQSPLRTQLPVGRSIWLDSLTRELLSSRELARLVQDGAVGGVSTNLAILLKAVSHDPDYDAAIAHLAGAGLSSRDILRELMMADVEQAAKLLRPLYEESGGAAGLVSMDLCLMSADDAAAGVAEARLVRSRLHGPNVLLKIPATRAGLAASEALIEEGINVDLTGVFDRDRYDAVALAYLDALDARARHGRPLDQLVSVASFSLNRIDAMTDPMLEGLVRTGASKCLDAAALRCGVALACAKVVYGRYRAIFDGSGFAALERSGARRQRLVWTDTAATSPMCRDVKYVDSLIGRETIVAMLPHSLAAFRDHGHPQTGLDDDSEEAELMLERLQECDIRIDTLAHELQRQYVGSLGEFRNALVAAIDRKRVRLG